MRKLSEPLISFVMTCLLSFTVLAHESCNEMETWDTSMGMCMPLAMKEMPMRMLMVQGHSFLVESAESSLRGRSDLAAPNMFMIDLGTSVSDSHYLNLDFMGTLERWTFPNAGYPELLQIGEANQAGQPFIDAQHPHSSPIMGLTFSDTIRLQQDSANHLKIFFAPRGESTDGPVAFMHRITGQANPDAPLGHHVGQDVGHISSTVLGASLALGHWHYELSGFNGTEPLPDAVDLPMGPFNSYALRIIDEPSADTTWMLSSAEVKSSDPAVVEAFRYSASLYTQHAVLKNWQLHNSLIFGSTTNYDGASQLSSWCEEFLLTRDQSSIWGRLEVLQRTAAELSISSPTNTNDGKWIEALTLGYTHELQNWQHSKLQAGAALTLDFVPNEFSAAYGSSTPILGRVFLQLSGHQMWDL